MQEFFAVFNPSNWVTQHADMRTSEGNHGTTFPALISSSSHASEVASATSCSAEVTSVSVFLRHSGKSHPTVVKKKVNRCPGCSSDRMEVLALAAVVLQEVHRRLLYRWPSKPQQRAPIMNVASTRCRSKLGGHPLLVVGDRQRLVAQCGTTAGLVE
ncbi:hypothetical protein MRX96_049953 [Rhipicephalus microplus]